MVGIINKETNLIAEPASTKSRIIKTEQLV